MTNEKLIAVAQKYRAIIQAQHSTAMPERLPRSNLRVVNPQSLEIADHLLHVCNSIEIFARANRRDKAMRWLGFLQGVLWITGQRSLDELAADNMPDNETFDANHR